MIDILYLHKKSRWGNELKYSLRSVEKYVDYDRVYVVGDYPQWLVNTTHIECETKGNRYEDVINKLDTALESMKSGKCLLMHDDIYLLEPYKPILYHNGRLEDRMKGTSGQRKQLFENTVRAFGKDLTNFCLHYPLPFYHILMWGLVKSMQLDGYHTFSYMSSYGNVDKTIPKKQADDCKFHQESITKKKLQGLPCFSTGGENDRLLHLFEQLYPNKSTFER